MLLSEFIERTGVTPTAEEYAVIEEQYYVFPGDKDAFCRAWCKVNGKRVNDAKQARKEREEKDKNSDILWNIIHKVDCYLVKHGFDYFREPLSVDFFNKTEWKLLDKIGVSGKRYTEKEAYEYGYISSKGVDFSPLARISDTQLAVKKYLKMA